MFDTTIRTMLRDYDHGRLSRRQLMVHLSGLVAVAAATPALGERTAKERTGQTFVATDVNHVALRVTDIGRSAEFYERHLGLTVTRRTESQCFLSCRDDNFLALFRGAKAGMDHYCFSLGDYTAADAVARLEAAGLTPRQREQRVYFDDPDGLEVQVAAR